MEGVRKQAALAHAVSLASDRKQTAPPTSPAAPADPDAERAAAWTEAERHETCGPRPGMYWLFATGHKTGTKLMDQFVNVSAGQSATNHEQVNLEDGVFSECFGRNGSFTGLDDSRLLGASCLAAAQATANRVILFRGGVLEEQELETALHNWQAQRLSTDNLRIVNSVRDPLEVIKSAYFYHLRGFEPSQSEVPSKMIAVLKRKCDGGENKPDDELCAALHAHDAATTSYAQLLQRLPPRLGILAEAAYEFLGSLRSVGGAAALAAGHPGVATTLELADVFEDFDATFRRLLRFLSVPEADVGACLAAISSLDVSSCAATPARCPAACL